MKLNFKIIILVLLQNSVNAWEWPWYRPNCQKLKKNLEEAKELLRKNSMIVNLISENNVPYTYRIPCDRVFLPRQFQQYQILFNKSCGRHRARFFNAENRYNKYCSKNKISPSPFYSV
jgi:hypothetical protein